jgi:hypothetical protein
MTEPTSELRDLVIGADLETASTAMVEVDVFVDEPRRAQLAELAGPAGAEQEVARFAILFAARLRALRRWRAEATEGGPEQRRVLLRLFDVALGSSSTGRFHTFVRGRQERAERWTINAQLRALGRMQEQLLPRMEQYNDELAARVHTLRSLLRDAAI